MERKEEEEEETAGILWESLNAHKMMDFQVLPKFQHERIETVQCPVLLMAWKNIEETCSAPWLVRRTVSRGLI